MAIRNIFQNYFYGNPGKQDFTEADLPENRLQLFRHVLGLRWGKMVWMNLLYLLFWLPAIVWTALSALQVGSILALAREDSLAALHQVVYTWLLILFPLIAVTGPFNAGVGDVFHRWARDEHCYPLTAFRSALKGNWKQGLLFGIMDGIAPLLVYLCGRFYLEMAARSPIFLLPMALLMIAMLLWFLAAPLMPQLIVSYELRFGSVLRNAFLMTLASLPRSIAIRLITCAVPILLLLSARFFPGAIIWIISLGFLLYIAFLLSFNKLIWASYANALGEKYLNTRIPGAPTNIGLRPNHGE